MHPAPCVVYPCRALNLKTMYTDLIIPIAKRAYESAKQRGKNPNCLNCYVAVRNELAEMWQAIDNGRRAQYADVAKAEGLQDNDLFYAFYKTNLHNTELDEMADVVITCATWLWCAKICAEAEGLTFNAQRNFDGALLRGPVSLVFDLLNGKEQIDTFRKIVNLKLRYNDLRKD